MDHSEINGSFRSGRFRICNDLGIEQFRRDIEDEVEFVTIMMFESLRDVIDFQGEDYARCHVPDAARKVLKRWDEFSSHYETIEHCTYGRD